MTLKQFQTVAILGSSEDPLASLLHVFHLYYIKPLAPKYVDHKFALKSNDKLMYRFSHHHYNLDGGLNQIVLLCSSRSHVQFKKRQNFLSPMNIETHILCLYQ